MIAAAVQRCKWGDVAGRTGRMPRPTSPIPSHQLLRLPPPHEARHHWLGAVNGCRGETPTVESMKDRVDYDIWYVNNWGLLLDLKIVLNALGNRSRRNAY
jgi:hypothetical protein